MSKKVFTQWYAMTARTGPQDGGTWAPNANVYERPEGLVVHIELAGIAADAIEVHVADQALVISGQRDDPVCPNGGPDCRVRRMEIEYGPFERVIPLPCKVDGDRATARSRHGILEVLLPRAQRRAPEAVRVPMPEAGS